MQIASAQPSAPNAVPPRELIVGEPGSPVMSGADPRFAQYKVIRRNGSVVAFEPSKITIAMTKAFLAINGGQGAASARVREQVRRVLREAGMLVDPSAFQDMIQPGLDFEAIRKEMRSDHVVPSLSELIIQERHEE